MCRPGRTFHTTRPTSVRRRAHVSRRIKHGGISASFTTSFPSAFTAFGSRQRSLLTKQLHDQCCAMKQYLPWLLDGRSTGLLLWVFIEQPDTSVLSWERDSVNKGRERCRSKKENTILLLLSCGDYIKNYVCRGVFPPFLSCPRGQTWGREAGTGAQSLHSHHSALLASQRKQL